MRRLPVYFVIDVSDSMVGEPIREVEKGMQGIIRELKSDPYALETVYVAIIILAGIAENLVPLTELIQLRVPDLPIGSGTSLGGALELLMDNLDNDVQLTTREKKGDWKPIVFLFTDGAPTDNPAAAISKWNAGYRNACNMVVVTFGNNADVALLQSISSQVLNLADTSSESFREFFRWVTASIKVSSMSIADSGDDGLKLAGHGIDLKKAEPGDMADENHVLLRVRCARNKSLWLAKYSRADDSPRPHYTVAGGYPVDESAYFRLSGQRRLESTVASSQLDGVPACPCCSRARGLAQCGSCGGLFCLSEDRRVTCPWCGAILERGTDNENLEISRSDG